MRYASIHSHKRAVLSKEEPPDLVLCTIQKANQLINSMVEMNQICRLRTIVIDEMHLIGDENRGYILELLLTKLVYMKRDTPSLPMQIVAMSATFPNLSQVADWLTAELYVTDFRPVAISEYVKTVGNQKAFFKIIPASGDQAAKLMPVGLKESRAKLAGDGLNLYELVQPLPGQCLVFCPSKANCEQYASVFAGQEDFLDAEKKQELEKIYKMTIMEYQVAASLQSGQERSAQSQQIISPNFAKILLSGVGYHHAGLSL